MQALIQPRSLTIEQQKAIGIALRPFAGQKIVVSSSSADPEAYLLSEQIVSALKSGHLDVEDRSGKGNAAATGLAEITGIRINWWLTEAPAMAVGEALKQFGQLKHVNVRREKHDCIGRRRSRTGPEAEFVLVRCIKTTPLAWKGTRGETERV
ncbi:MAG TPA: hypothetical protein VJT08_10275 [Terriglobales bacterium]|nr:hypothetical protein [Terriglobales bacterium]